MLRSIVLFPQLGDALNDIESFRRKFDPLYDKILPHATLVFPFESDLPTEELRQYLVDCVAGIHRFELSFGTPVFQTGGYVWLPIETGASVVRKIHDTLYCGPLHRYFREDIPYVPHLTIGRFSNEEEGTRAHEMACKFNASISGVIDSVVIEQIGADEFSRIVVQQRLSWGI